LDPDLYIDAINALGATLDCPSCGRFDWTPATEYMLVPASPEQGVTVDGRFYPIVALICNHCGFMRMHFTPILEREPPPPKDPIEAEYHEDA
jgi:hypothetical protein